MEMTVRDACSIPDCEKPAKSRGWCTAHYSRWLRTGDVGPAAIWDRTRKTCEVLGCDHPAVSAGLCNGHRQRLSTTQGLRPEVPLGHRSPPSYYAMHERLRRQLGSASRHDCADCGGQAAEWAYDGLDEHEQVRDRRRFSSNTAHYMPMCVPCHRAYDSRGRALHQSDLVATA